MQYDVLLLRPCPSDLGSTFDELVLFPELVDEGRGTDIIYLDLCTVFVPDSDNILVANLERCGLDGWTRWWIRNGRDGLTRRVVVNVSMAVWRTGMSGDPQRLVLGSL